VGYKSAGGEGVGSKGSGKAIKDMLVELGSDTVRKPDSTSEELGSETRNEELCSTGVSMRVGAGTEREDE